MPLQVLCKGQTSIPNAEPVFNQHQETQQCFQDENQDRREEESYDVTGVGREEDGAEAVAVKQRLAKFRSDLNLFLMDLLGQERLTQLGHPKETADKILVKILAAAGLEVILNHEFVSSISCQYLYIRFE